MDEIITTLQTNHIPEITCLATQLILTLHTGLNLHRNREEFPVKQLSPLLSFTALICFFLINIISFTTKIIETSNEYYNSSYESEKNCGQCRLFNHPEMIALAIIYNGLRELPLIIFIVKTYRVCLCYKISYEKQLSERVKWLFSSEKKLLLLSVFITIVLMIIGYVVYGEGSEHYGHLVFEFFCPKESSVYDWLLTTLRFFAMAYVYIISIYTYNELDFKRLLILIFILTNTEVLLRLILVITDITKKTYHEFYYHSFVMNLFGTLIMLYYSTIKEQRNEPLTLPIIESFKTFLQSSLGYTVLTLFAEDIDEEAVYNTGVNINSNKNINNNTNTNNINININNNRYKITFESYITIEEINIIAYYNNYKIKPEHIPQLEEILSNPHISSLIDNTPYLLEKCQLKEISSIDLQELEMKLYKFCERNIFNEWRQTESCKYLEGEFKNNGVINLRMDYIGIKLK